MKWKEVWLTNANVLVHNHNVELFLSQAISQSRNDSRKSVVLRFVSPAGSNSVILENLLDDGETTLHPRAFVIFSDATNSVFLVGGVTAYHVNTAAEVESVLKLFRYVEDSEFWYMQLVAIEPEVAVIYEGGVFILQNLTVRWHTEKFYNDFFCGFDNEKMFFLRDHEEKLAVLLRDGSLIDGQTD